MSQGILLDQFGVLHDGKTAYPSAIQAVQKLSQSGRKIVILSNSSRRKLGLVQISACQYALWYVLRDLICG